MRPFSFEIVIGVPGRLRAWTKFWWWGFSGKSWWFWIKAAKGQIFWGCHGLDGKLRKNRDFQKVEIFPQIHKSMTTRFEISSFEVGALQFNSNLKSHHFQLFFCLCQIQHNLKKSLRNQKSNICDSKQAAKPGSIHNHIKGSPETTTVVWIIELLPFERPRTKRPPNVCSFFLVSKKDTTQKNQLEMRWKGKKSSGDGWVCGI